MAAIAMRFAALAALPVSVQAADPAERVAERIHSNLPLYTFQWEDMWPRGFHSDDSFGCSSWVKFGDWHFIPADPKADREYWDRYTNYGVFHCAAIMRTSRERAELGEAQWKHGFFVRLGKARLGSREWELWALQQGMVPGSDYILLAREPRIAAVDSFRVLQRRCPRGRILETSLDVWTTRYCPIDSRAELLSLARRMLRLPPLGTISHFPGSTGTEGED